MRLKSIIAIAIVACVIAIISVNVAYAGGGFCPSPGSTSSPVPGAWVADQWFNYVCFGGF
ncbi:MAG: hypothetical protein D9C04_06110 [Nitrosopumilus sp. B06]|nr:MAG: hypothetical protein D9C04_06110 [Nitrosopumilus sp. B06]